MPGRVREAIPLRAQAGRAPWLVTVSRTGHLDLVRVEGAKLARREVAREPMGLGRVAMTSADDGREILYVTRDDGLILRFAGSPENGFDREIVFAGPQGPRGIVVGRFDADPDKECIAIFGYSEKVQLLSRLPGDPWSCETIFTDVDKGHWLTTAELDGRNGTTELIGSGYGGRVFLLSRPPGYGLEQDGRPVAADDGGDAASGVVRRDADTIRVGLRARAGAVEKLTPLCYTGGFEPKTMLYETLVRRGSDGRIVPGLAESWSFEDGGRTVRFVLREGARFHDDTPVTASAVREHFRRWFGFPEHDWLPGNRRIETVEAESERVVRVTLDRPFAILPALCAVNPCAIQGPGSRDREGEFERPVGTGAFRFVDADAGGDAWRVERFGANGGPESLEVRVYPRGGNVEPIDAMRRGEIDVFVGGWDEDLPHAQLRELERDPGIRVVDAPGSSVVRVAFRLDGGPTARLEIRRRIAAAISRSALIRDAEGGYADPCTAWAAPSVTFWPKVDGESDDRAAIDAALGSDGAGARTPGEATRLRIASGSGGRASRVARLLAEQLAGAGFDPVLADEAAADLRVEISHGLPYDPHLTLVRRFGSESGAEGVPPELSGLVDRAAATPGEENRIPIYAEIQAVLDREVLIVPLYVPRRIALCRADLDGIELGPDVYHVDLTGLGRR